MVFVEMCVTNSFIFSVSALTVFQSWFLSHGNLVFFLDIILFRFSTIICSSCVTVCSVWFWCVLFRFLFLCGSIRWECSCFSVFVVSIIILGSCCFDSIFIWWCISRISRSENQPFFMTNLTWSASLWLLWKLAHSLQISIIPFLYLLCVGLLLK